MLGNLLPALRTSGKKVPSIDMRRGGWRGAQWHFNIVCLGRTGRNWLMMEEHSFLLHFTGCLYVLLPVCPYVLLVSLSSCTFASFLCTFVSLSICQSAEFNLVCLEFRQNDRWTDIQTDQQTDRRPSRWTDRHIQTNRTGQEADSLAWPLAITYRECELYPADQRDTRPGMVLWWGRSWF